MSFNKKFLSKSPLAYHGGPHNGQPNVKANTKAFSTMSDILPKKNITSPQQSNYGLGTSTNANWDKPKKPSDEQKAKSLEMPRLLYLETYFFAVFVDQLFFKFKLLALINSLFFSCHIKNNKYKKI